MDSPCLCDCDYRSGRMKKCITNSLYDPTTPLHTFEVMPRSNVFLASRVFEQRTSSLLVDEENGIPLNDLRKRE